ncbi:MAG: sodium/proline symporter [Bacteroidales bacterium]|nr:sodium/proline symporter [Bacteroidales bacterium]
MEANQLELIIVMIAYMVLIVSYGFYIGRKVKNSEDYAIAGRHLPGWAAALSERATGESAWALLGLPGAAYALGIAEAWTALGCASGIILGWIFIARKLRKEAQKYNANTFMDYISKRHGQLGVYIKIVGSLVVAFFFFFYIGAQFIGGGKTFTQIIDIDIHWSIVIVVLLVVPYTIYGGFQSVVYTDVIQALLMVITLVIAPIIGIWYISNNPDVYAASITEALQKAGPAYYQITGLTKGFGTGVIIISGFSWMFGYLGGMPQLAVRFMAIENEKEARKARNIAVLWTVAAYTGALMLGWIGIAIFGPESAALKDREAIMPAVLFKIFPNIIAAILITGVFAAIVSTANSLLILVATEMSENIITPDLFKRKVKISKLLISRILTTVLAVAAFVFALIFKENLIYNIVKYVWAGIGDTFSVVIMLTLFWKRFHAKAALCTIIGGIIFTVFWIESGLEKWVSCLVMTFVFSMLVAVVTTFLFPPKE